MNTRIIALVCLLFAPAQSALAQLTGPAEGGTATLSVIPTNVHLSSSHPAILDPIRALQPVASISSLTLADTGKAPDSSRAKVPDSSRYNMYGLLRNDDPVYTPRSPWYIPAIKVVGSNLFTFAVDKFLLNSDFSVIGLNSWAYNIKNGWEWDQDRFGMNFFFHPYTGAAYFNAARSTGYTFWESIPFAAGGSLMWEYFGENTRPSYSDLMETTIAGTFGGEILYRLSSQLLDDRTSGAERFFREAGSAIIAPTRFLTRLIQGALWRDVPMQIYEKEPLNVTLYAGTQLVNDGAKLLTGHANLMANLQLDYGNPFENIDRKPFDFFRLRADLSFAAGRKIIDNVTGYGILYGVNAPGKEVSTLVGAFQYYDFWDNSTFELGTLGVGVGVINKYPFLKTLNLYTALHVAVVPIAGNSSIYGPNDTSQVRDYNYGGGLEGKFETTLTLGNVATARLIAYCFWVHTYVGLPGNNFITMLTPRVTFAIYDQLSLGFEQMIYFGDRYLRDLGAIHTVRTEQKLFLMLYMEDPQRSGHYN